jgi:hypothetical protein
MIEAAEQTLLALGIPLGRIESERFDINAAEALGSRHAQVRHLVRAALFAGRLG